MSKISLQSSDNEIVDVEMDAVQQIEAVQTMLDDVPNQDNTVPIPIPNITGEILQLVADWVHYHKNDPEYDCDNKAREIPKWDADFLNVEQRILFRLLLAANYLNIKGLLDITCKTVANMIKGKSPNDIRKTLHIINDFDPVDGDNAEKEDDQPNNENQQAAGNEPAAENNEEAANVIEQAANANEAAPANN